MSARRPRQPLRAQSVNVTSTKSAPFKTDDDDDTNDSGISGLTSLENASDAADDDFERLMIQQARDERRLQDALRGNVQPFRKARTHPRVGLTLENLERHEEHAQRGTGIGSGPSSSSGASDPAVRPPVEWGRKARVRKNWLRTITSGAEQELGAQEDILDQLAEATPRPAERGAGFMTEDVPRPSVEDSPLSRKSSIHGTPTSARRRNDYFDQDSDLDLSIDFNEASMIASTPYVPRNTALDDIRQREIESLREEAVATSRRKETRERSAEEGRKPASSPKDNEQTTQGANAAQHRRRTSPILVYKKSTETVGTVDPQLSANGQTSPEIRTRKREDSHNLLRRLARASSNTPSPARTTENPPETAPERRDSFSPRKSAEKTKTMVKDNVAPDAPAAQIPSTDSAKEQQRRKSPPPPILQPSPVVEATPMRAEPSILSAKTPRVTGAWVDTPGPATARRPSGEPSQLPSPPPENRDANKKSLEKGTAPQTQQQPEQPQAPAEIPRPNLPRSALEAIVEEAKANGTAHRHDDQFGDSTISSLEDLISPATQGPEGAEADEDTLQGLQLPTEAPRTEAERLRQKELAQLHKMNQRLRSARTSIRDASRGMRNVGHQMEHIEGDGEAALAAGVHRLCPGHQNPWTIAWVGFKRLWYKTELRGTRTRGLTWLTIGLLTFVTWFISESLACDQYCHKLYASSMIGFGVDENAPRFPFVIPTLMYRNLQRPWKLLLWPLKLLWAVLTWFWGQLPDSFSDTETETLRRGATSTIRKITTTILHQAEETFEPDDYGFGDDEVL